MNIFFLDRNPIKAAQYLCDKHVCKMIIETAQILSTVVRLKHEQNDLIPFGIESLYEKTHVNHPCTKWAGLSIHNFNWLVTHGLAIADQYRQRYHKEHKCTQIIKDASSLAFLDLIWYKKSLTKPPLCVREDCKIVGDPVKSYRIYYWRCKKKFAKWRYSVAPSWWGKKLYH